MQPIRVMIVDDSVVVRTALRRTLSTDSDVEVVGEAVDPLEARELLPQCAPDVLLLDLEMPRMDGLTFLKQLMAEQPLPVVVISGLTSQSTSVALRCLEAGALDVLAKPHGGYSLGSFVHDLRVVLLGLRRNAVGAVVPARMEPRTIAPEPGARIDPSRVVVLGASTGGPEALRGILASLPPNSPGIAVVQHMPAGFTTHLAERLDDVCGLQVLEGSDGMEIRPSRVVIAPSGMQTEVRMGINGLPVIRVREGDRVCMHLPSVEVLFSSASELSSGKALGVLLTGMGDDGAEGLLKMRQAGHETIAQDQESCAVYGMPRVAAEKNAAKRILPLSEIASAIHEFGTSQRRLAG